MPQRIWNRLRKTTPAVLIGALLIVAGVWTFLGLTSAVRKNATDDFDKRVVRSMRLPDDPATPRGPRWFQEGMRDLTALGGQTVLILLSCGVCGFLWLRGHRMKTLFVAASVLGGLAVGMLLKSLIDRPRPDIVPHLSYVHTTSFPSGHSMMSAVVFLTLGALTTTVVETRRLKIYVLFFAILMSGLVGVSRVYLGVHYPTDVLAGWTAGLTWSLVCWLVMRTVERRIRAEKVHEVIEQTHARASR